MIDDEIADPITEVIDSLASFEFDPLGFVMWAFPWGQEGTDLEDDDGPEQWQRDQLTRIGEELTAGGDLGAVVQEAISAGHGVGKSAIVSWLILWAISTFEDTRGVVTANTDHQLRTKTWAELARWYNQFMAKELFVLTATAIYSADPKHVATWRIDAVPWNAAKPEAVAGLHNKGKRLLIIYDESAAIDDIIWETQEGALTDAKTQIIWCAYGNPTRTSGRFHKECSRPKRFTYNRVDSRTVRFTNKAQIAEWVADYGEDSDFVRVRVEGKFPRAGFSNFISPELTEGARRRVVPRMAYTSFQKILSIDPARFGDDFSVITLRQGLKVHWQQAMSGFDGPDLAGRVVEIVRQESGISCIVYDANGNGADLDSALRRAPGLPALIPVMWSIPAADDKKYFNQRSEAWGTMKDWLPNGEIPDDDVLCDELSMLDYGYDGIFRIQLQTKKDCKKNGGKSPDRADSLALSFIPELINRKVVTAKVRPTKRRKVIWSGRITGQPVGWAPACSTRTGLPPAHRYNPRRKGTHGVCGERRGASAPRPEPSSRRTCDVFRQTSNHPRRGPVCPPFVCGSKSAPATRSRPAA